MTDLEQKPRLRFKGFTEAWEQRKLNEIVSYASSSLSAKDAADDGKWNLYDANHLIGKTNLFFVRDDYITIIKDGAGVGRVRLLPKNSAFIGTMGALLPLNSDLLFDYALLTKADLSRKFSGSTIPHIYFKDYGNETYRTPLLLEQQKIGSLFERLDSLITLHQRKYEKLKSMKAALLEKIFPSENETTPKIRFKGFTEAWEQRKLGDVVQITMGQSPDGSTYSDEPSDYILVQGNADLQNGWVCPRIWTTQITKKADAGDLIMSVRAPAGAMGKTAYNAVIGRGVAAIKGNEFIYQLLVKMDTDGFWKTLSCGSTFESLNSDNIKNAEVKIPTTAEQIKIGGLFQYLDNLITLHQRKQYIKLTKP